ncbi:MAG: hypothetical protein M1832_002410 [Thelocarpon impressellum]|nr:MAG: hypothetical protein M1832_002410 [Thelocarpon impressellum]
MTRRRRASSGLGGEIRGDTGAPAVSTLDAPSPSPAQSPSPVPSSSPGEASKDRRRPAARQQRRPRTLFQQWKDLSFRHTWVNPLIVIAVVLAAYARNPTPSNPLHSALFISYPQAQKDPSVPVQYGKGRADFAFVAFYVVVLSFTREFLMQQIIRPIAKYLGLRSRAKQSRFMEQMYTAVYFAFFGPLGLYVMSRTPVWYFNTTAFYTDYPHMTHEAIFKAYYLLQASYWAQQAIVLMLQLEKPRKDFKELVGHHIVTLALIGLSYRFHFTHMGLAVYITHDISDFFLATSKCLNYLDSIIVGPYFGMFAAVWIYLRHYLNWRILWASLSEFRTVGPYQLNWEGEQYKGPLSQTICFVLLASLQAVNLFWLYLIFKIARNYLFANTWADERSEGEEEEDEEEDEKEDAVETKASANGILQAHAETKKGESYSDAVKEGKKAK